MAEATDPAGVVDPTPASVTWNVDATAPTITITAPASGATYARGALVNGSYACADTGGSGLAFCAGLVANGAPIDTAVAGSYLFTVNAADQAGNTASKTVTYTVIGDKNACKNGGWQTFTSPVFRNQGECVSYFATMK